MKWLLFALFVFCWAEIKIIAHNDNGVILEIEGRDGVRWDTCIVVFYIKTLKCIACTKESGRPSSYYLDFYKVKLLKE